MQPDNVLPIRFSKCLSASKVGLTIQKQLTFRRRFVFSQFALTIFSLWLSVPASAYHGPSVRPKVDATTSHGIYLTARGTIMAWGSNSGAAFCGGGVELPKGSATLQEIQGISGVADIAVGKDLTFLIMSDGAVLACGRNSDGQAGVGRMGIPEEYYNRRMLVATPTPVTGLHDPKQIAIGSGFVVALLEDGRVMGWGSAYYLAGIAPSNPNVPGIVSFPRLISGISGVREIAAGATFTLALMHDGTVKGWGVANRGELGKIGTFLEPVTIPGLNGVRHIAVAGRTVAALLEDGTVKVWGDRQTGMIWSRVGDLGARNGYIAQPVKVPGLSNVEALYGGLEGTNFIAMLRDGSVRMWGYNGFYQQGLGHNEEYPLRLVSPNAKGVVSAVSALNGTYLLLEDGRLLNAGAHHNRPRNDSLKVHSEIWPSYPPARSLGSPKILPPSPTGVVERLSPSAPEKLSTDDDYNEAVRKGDVLFETGKYFDAVREYERAWRIAYNRKLKIDSNTLDNRLSRAREARDKKK